MEPPASNHSAASMMSQVLGTGLFNSFDAVSLRDLEAELRWIRVAAGDALFQQGDAGDSMYILIRGRLQVSIRHADGMMQVIDELDPGVSVGDTALLTGQMRSAMVIAIAEAELLQFSSAAFERLATKNPAAMLSFAETMVPRLLRTQQSAWSTPQRPWTGARWSRTPCASPTSTAARTGNRRLSTAMAIGLRSI